MTIDNVVLSTQNSISPEYPLNLLQAVDSKYRTWFVPADIDETIEYLLHVLFSNMPKGADVLRKHFKYGKTYAEIACEYQDTEEQIQQTEKQALCKLQYPTCIECLTIGIFQLIMYHRGYYGHDKFPDFVTPVTRIDMVDLSTRCQTGLRYAGIHTIGDLEKLTSAQLKSIRNIGQRSYDEIIEMLRHYNIKLREE